MIEPSKRITDVAPIPFSEKRLKENASASQLCALIFVHYSQIDVFVHETPMLPPRGPIFHKSE
jgi:hypothetical protein